MGKFNDLTGFKFGRLLVLETDEEKNKEERRKKESGMISTYRNYWLCQCECGNKVSVHTTALKNGNTKSCGCFNIDRIRERNKLLKTKENKIEVDYENNEARVYTENMKKYFTINLEDINKIKGYYWSMNGRYWKASKKDNTGEFLIIQNVIMDNDNVGIIEVDHIDRNTSNNKKENLRKTDHRDNCINRGMLSNNTSGVKGVSYCKRDSLWKAYIKVKGKSIGLGYYKAFEEAVVARRDGELKYGYYEYSCNKDMFDILINLK